MTPPRHLLFALLVLSLGSRLSAQFEDGYFDEDTVRTAREVMPRTFQLPPWTNPRGFERDVFCFTRIIFSTDPRRQAEGGFGGFARRGWAIDFPDADMNFSHRLQQMSSMKVDSDGRILKLTNPDLLNHPFIFMTHIERMALSEREAGLLRQYLLNGGFLLVNDFWGKLAWLNLVSEMRRVLPGHSWTELTMAHPIFHSVFELRGPMSELRVPTIHRWNRGYIPKDPSSNPTSGYRGEGYETMHVQALKDERDRIMVLAIHNSDVSDGWEREGENADYFATFSEPRAYPLAINIIFYLMTH